MSTKHITDSVVESMNRKLNGNKETSEYKWFNAEDFDGLLKSSEIVPYPYCEGWNKDFTFREFFDTKAKEFSESNYEVEI